MHRKLTIAAVLLSLAGAMACAQAKGAYEVEPGTDVTLEKKDGVRIAGRLVEVRPEHITVEARDGTRTSVPRAEVTALRAATTDPPRPAPRDAARSGETSSGAPAEKDAADAAKIERPEPARYREVTIPAGTALPVELRTSVSSDASKIEDPVRATLRKPVIVGGIQALPAGTAVLGHVTAAERSARVKGRAFVAFRFTAIDPPGDAGRVAVRTDPVTRLAPATRKADAAKIGGGAAGGAIIGGILGGGDGAAKGAAIGGAAGTGVVLSTRGKEVRLGPGANVSVRLAAPVTLRVPEQ